jgi:protease I
MSHHHIPKDIFMPQTMNQRADKSIIILTDNNTEDLEFFYPFYRFIEEGFHVTVATLSGGEFKGKHGTGLQDSKKIAEIMVADFDLLYIPGGKAPAKLKKSEDAVVFVRQFYETGKPIAALCHGPQLLAEADVIQGRRIAAWPDVESELTKAGAEWVSSECVVDGQFITGRWPGDLPSQVARTIEVLRSQELRETRPFHTETVPAVPGTSRLQ